MNEPLNDPSPTAPVRGFSASVNYSNYSSPPPMAVPNMLPMVKFMILLNNRFPIDYTGKFQGNHSVVYDQRQVISVGVWIWKDLDWRLYPVGLSDADLLMTPEELVAEVARCVDAEVQKKLIVPTGHRRAQ